MNAGLGDMVLYAIALVAAVVILTPVLMVLVGFARVAVHVTPGVAVEPTGDDPDYQRRYQQFVELGFQPAGVTRETCWFIAAFHWYWRSHDYQRWMTAPDGKTLVTLYRMVAVEPVRFTLKSVCEGGAVVSTTCPGAGIGSDSEAYLRVEYQNLEPAELLAKHRAHVDAFELSRRRRNQACTFAEAAKADGVHDQQLLTSGAPGSRGVYEVLIVLALPAFLAFQFLPQEGSRLHRGAFAFLIGALIYAGLRFLYLPKVVAQNALNSHAPAAPGQRPPAAGAPGATP